MGTHFRGQATIPDKIPSDARACIDNRKTDAPEHWHVPLPFTGVTLTGPVREGTSLGHPLGRAGRTALPLPGGKSILRRLTGILQGP